MATVRNPVTGEVVELKAPVVTEKVEVPPEQVLEITEEGKAVEFKPLKKRMYMAGKPVLATEAQEAKFNELSQELQDILGDNLISEISLGHPYYAKRAELDVFVSTLSV